MPHGESLKAEHSVTVSAPARAVYALIVAVENWPRLFPPTIYVDYVEHSVTQERIRIWATANGAVKNWTSRRRLDPTARRIDFRQEISSPPVGSMGGSWLVEELPGDECRVRLLHDYTASDGSPESVAWIERAVDRNSRSELAALKANAELATRSAELLMSFEDTVHVRGPAKDVYDFLNQADRWAERLPHVPRVSLREEDPGLQVLEMDTRTKDGSIHTTRSVRVCFPHHLIVYKQIEPPALMSLHTGQWTLADTGDGTAVTSQHTVVIRPEKITEILGEGAGINEARTFVQAALSGNSRATLGHAKAYAERP